MLFNSSLSTSYILCRTLAKQKQTFLVPPLSKLNFLSYCCYNKTIKSTTKQGRLNGDGSSNCNNHLSLSQRRGWCSQSSAEPTKEFLRSRKRQKFSELPTSLVRIENPHAKNYQNNVAKSQQLIAEYEAVRKASLAGGGPRAIERHVKFHRKLLARERIKLLLDDDEEDSFLELSQVAGMGMEYGNVPQAGMLAGIGRVHGIDCLIMANEATVKGGSIYPIGVKKQLRIQEIGLQNRLPCIYLVDSGGAFLPLQSEIFPDKNHGGRTFYNIADMNSQNIPQITVVLGHCTAGAAYIPTMSHEVVIVQRIGAIFLGGPPLVKAALGEIVSTEDLGGANMHSSISGCSDHYASTEPEAFTMVRDIVASINQLPAPMSESGDEPLYDPLELLGIIPAEGQHNMDPYKIIARITDGSRFGEFKKRYGPNLVTGFAHINRHLVGIIGNKGGIGSDAATKGSQFVQLCNQRGIPLIFLQNTLPDSLQEISSTHHEIYSSNRMKSHGQMMAAIGCANVPKITMIVGNAFGMDHYLMCGRAMSPNFLFSWPNAKIGLMESDALLNSIMQETDLSEERKCKLQEKLSHEVTALHASSRIWNDGIVLPQQTRQVLTRCLEICRNSSESSTNPFLRM